jgi:hypothetical protein
MYDDAHPTVMLSGLLLGMLMAMTLFAGSVAWHNAVAESCRLTALKSGTARPEHARHGTNRFG